MDVGPSQSGEGAPHTGTTIVAVSYAGGVVLGADSRVSTGTYISNRASDKITPLCDNVYLLRSGSAADTQAVRQRRAADPILPLPLFKDRLFAVAVSQGLLAGWAMFGSTSSCSTARIVFPSQNETSTETTNSSTPPSVTETWP